MDYIIPSSWFPWNYIPMASSTSTTTYTQALALFSDDIPAEHASTEWTFWQASSSIYHSFILVLQDSHSFLGQYWNYLVFIIQLVLFLLCLKILIYTLSTMEELFTILQKILLKIACLLGLSHHNIKSQYHLL